VTLETLNNDLANKARIAAPQLSSVPDAAATLPLERLRDQLGASDVVLFNGAGQQITSVTQSRFQISSERPTPQQFRNARTSRVVSWVEGLDEATPATVNDARIKALAVVANPGFQLQGDPRYLLVTQALPGPLVTNALAVTQANREYQERSLAREGLRRMYIGTLTLSLFLAVFGAVLLAVVLGNQIVRPLLLLADGMSQVAAGDLTPKVALQGKDELGGLTRSFADMTQQLSDARQAVGASMEQVNAARANLQTILDNLTAGVIVLDADGMIVSSPGPPASCACRWRSTRGNACLAWRACRSLAPRYKSGSTPFSASAARTVWTTGSNPSSWAAATWRRLAARRRAPSRWWRAAPSCRARTACWCSTISPRSSRPSVPRPGARWRVAWPTRSRTRSRPSSSRPSGWR